MQQQKKKEGFEGQKAIVIPKGILAGKCARHSLLSNLYITDIGYYPSARFHFRERPQGADQHILIYCQQGAGMAVIGQQKIEIKPGDFFVVPMHTPHLYAAAEHNPWTIYWVHFKGKIAGDLVALLMQQAGSAKGNLRYPESSLALFDEICSQLEKGYGSDQLIYANMCFSHFLTSCIYNDKFGNTPALQPTDPIEQAITFFQQHLDQMLPLEEMAAFVNLSPSHFSNLFKKKTGFPPIQYFNHLKVQKACQYLRFTTLRIKEIANLLGMEDPYYFSRLFSKVMGISAREYRDLKKW